MGNKDIETLEIQHKMKMEQLAFERETQMRILEKQFEIEMRLKGMGNMGMQQQYQQPQYIVPNHPNYVEEPPHTDIERSTSKYSKKK